MSASTREYDGAVDKGLEGIIACTTRISSIMDTTLAYRGYTIEDLAEHSSFEEVVFLLWNDRLPKKDELQALRQVLVANMGLSTDTIALMKNLPVKEVLPMDYLRSVVSSLALLDLDSRENTLEANRRKALRLTGSLGAIVAGFNRLREGLAILSPNPAKSIAWNFLYLLQGKEPDSRVAKIFDTCLVLHADHEINCSTFSARVTASSLSDLYSSITAAIGTLKGPLHGGANEQVIRMLLRIGSVDATKKFIEDALANREKVMGVGHRVYKNGDPRAKILRKMSEALTAMTDQRYLYEMSVAIDEIMQAKKGLMPNVDFYSATVYYCMGIPIDLFTPVFAVSRVSGWLAHVFEQFSSNRIYRPRGRYVGHSGLNYIALDART